MSEIWDLSTTDASNNDSSFGFPENMNPSAVNNNMRAILGAIKRFYDDTNGTLVSAGSSSAYTVASPNRSLTTSYSDGLVIMVQMHTACANTATLAVDGKTAKKIMKSGANVTLSASDILANQICLFAYETTADFWQMLSPVSNAGAPSVFGPGSSTTDNSLVKWDGTTGKLLKNGAVIGTDVQAYNADTLFADVDDTLTAGFAATADADGTKTSGTYTPTTAGGNFKTATNGGAHTLAPQTSVSTIVIQYTNDGSAGSITTSGWDKVSGDSLTTTNGHDFMMYLTVIGSFQHLHVVALQ